MASIMLISGTNRETQILKLAFEQNNIKIIASTTDYKDYVKILQYIPDILLIELPRIAHTQIHFIEMLRQHKKTKNIPIIGYGDKLDSGIKKGLMIKGIYYYIDRPLKFSSMIDIIAKCLKNNNKDLGLKQKPVNDMEKDIEALLNKDTLPTKKIEIMTTYVSKLMAFPFTVAKILQIADSEKSGAGDLAKVIQADPVLSAQMLRISNSVLFASINRKISSVKDAIIRVGFRETKRLAMSMSVMKLFGDTAKNTGFDRASFWQHSLTCGIISERMAKQMGTVNTEESFLAGILHDFGILLLDEFFPALFSKILENTTTARTRFINVEKELLGVSHNEMIAELFTKWKLPDSILEGITLQYQINEFKNQLDTPGKKIALCVGLGDMVTKSSEFGRECDMFVSPVENWAFEQVRMPAGITSGFLENIGNQLNIYREFLKIEKQEGSVDDADKAAAAKIRVGIINPAKDIFVQPQPYLQNQGYTVTKAGYDTVTKLNGKASCYIFWTDANTTPEILAPFSKITAFSENTGQNTIEYAPVFVFIDEKSTLNSHKNELGAFTLFNKSFDLRELDPEMFKLTDALKSR
jgi:HD-like signal output (HDOD) protein